MTCEGYFGHRTRLYEIDLYNQPEPISKIIKKSYDEGIRGINIPNNKSIFEGLDIARKEGAEMEIIGTVGHTKVNYLMPDMKKARQDADCLKDIEVLSKYDSSIMLVDDFLVDAYDWDYVSQVLQEIKDSGALAGIITSRPFETSRQLADGKLDSNLYDFYMLPINKLGYTMDVDFFIDEEQEEMSNLLNKINKKIIISRILACGIQTPKEAFTFLKTLDYADMVAVSVASEREAEQTFGTFREL
ncbi:hypothetical protein BGI41_05085 [Methanobrevibacter sp. 87.7]|uniref:hypothetical protein n=1 Tax=Methanobrevibacter sp. 87.7 TaxID=387957 RepID=UPI000B5010D9|nr:hypothetical protein [Methanobrevibacter sp. 87.7]OWT32921.1 hypothetical protein BGI41_05085 [Methanobrevibacter sp. 87.7]